MPFVFQIDGFDPVAGAAVTLRAASVDDAGVCHLDGQVWWPMIDRLPMLAMDFFGGVFGAVTTPGSSISLSTEVWPLFSRYVLDDARIRMWQGEAGAAWGAWVLRFDGRVTNSPTVDYGRAEITFAVDDRWLDQPLLDTFDGTGGIEGPAELKGTPKPLAIGAPSGVPGVLLDSVRNIIQLHGYGAVESVDVPLERLARQFGSVLADHASFAALSAASVPAGQWATCKASGLVRMGAPAFGRLCFLMKGDKGGAGGWVRRAGAIITRIADLAGGLAKVDAASMTALDVARPYDLSLYQGDQTTARALIQSVAASVNAVAGVDWLGRLFAIPVQINAEGHAFKSDGSAEPMVASVRQLGNSAPWWRLAIGAQPFWDVHAISDVARDSVSVLLGVSTERAPAAPPTSWARGSIYIDASNRQFRFEGAEALFGSDPILFGTDPVIGAGYQDVQDTAIASAATTADWSAVTGAAKPADNADVTALVVPIMNVSETSVTLNANYQGKLTDNQLPKSINASRFKGAVDVSAVATWSLVNPIGFTPSASITVSTTGVFTVPAGVTVSPLAIFTIRSVYEGVTLDQTVSFATIQAGSPVSTPSGTDPALWSEFTAVSGTAMVAIGPKKTITTGATGRIDFAGSLSTFVLENEPTGSFEAAVIFRYALAGAGLGDAGAETVTEPDATVYYSVADGWYFSSDGGLSLAVSVTGLAASTAYDVQPFARKTSASAKTVNFAGSLSATPS